MARLQSNFGAIDVLDSPALGTPEVVSVKPGGGFLTAPTTNRVGAMHNQYYASDGRQPCGDLRAIHIYPAAVTLQLRFVHDEQRFVLGAPPQPTDDE